mgnify:FL=1
MMATVQAPAYLLDTELFSDVGVATPLGPSLAGSSAPGWPNALWARQPMRLYGVEYNLDAPLNVRLKLGDMRQFACNYWESASYQRAADEQRQGGAQFGRAVRVYTRDSYAWVEDPLRSGVYQTNPGVEKVGTIASSPVGSATTANVGLSMEMPASNYLLRSSFISQLTGLTAPTAQTGASVAATSSTPIGMLFNTVVTGYCLHIIGPNPSTSADYLEGWPATVGLSTGFGPRIPSRFVLAVDYAIINGPSDLTWTLQRGNDSHFYKRSDKSWTSTSQVNNSGFAQSYFNPWMTVGLVGAVRGVEKIATSSGTTTLTFKAGVGRSDATPGKEIYIFHTELIGAYDATSSGTVSGFDSLFLSSRIVTDTSRASRSADNLRLYDATSSGGGVMAPFCGTILCRFSPQWVPSDFQPGTSGVWQGITPWVFLCGESASAGSSGSVNNIWQGFFTFSTSDSSLFSAGFGAVTSSGSAGQAHGPYVAGTTNQTFALAFRYTSSSGGELGLSANTISVFMDGVKGDDTQLAAKPTAYAPFYFSNVITASSGGTRTTAGGIISDIQFRPYAMTDAEIAAWSVPR